MLHVEDHSGLVAFLLGIVVVVLVAVGLSMLVDQHRGFSSGEPALRKAILADFETISRLTATLEQLEASEVETRGRTDTLRLAKLDAENIDLDRNVTRARADIDALAEDVKAIDRTFSEYREDYRQSEWSRAVGESLGTVTVSGGRVLRQTRITKVTEVGLEIQHEEGLARIHASDLPAALRDRFQWDETRRARALAEEQRHEQAVAAASDTPPTPAAKPAPQRPPLGPIPVDPASAQLAKLRSAVILCRSKVVALKSDHLHAQAQASSGMPSVPGSLETWRAKASRLGSELAAARAALAIARERLAALDPAHPLVRPDPKVE